VVDGVWSLSEKRWNRGSICGGEPGGERCGPRLSESMRYAMHASTFSSRFSYRHPFRPKPLGSLTKNTKRPPQTTWRSLVLVSWCFYTVDHLLIVFPTTASRRCSTNRGDAPRRKREEKKSRQNVVIDLELDTGPKSKPSPVQSAGHETIRQSDSDVHQTPTTTTTTTTTTADTGRRGP
jgi:hypothetical protein